MIPKPKTFLGTKAEFDLLPSDGEYYCPNCGLAITHPCGSCGCPTRRTQKGFYFTEHINRYHHDCEIAWEKAYGKERMAWERRKRITAKCGG